MGSEKRDGMANKSVSKFPGAGTYDLPSKVGEGPKFVMGLHCGQTAINAKAGSQPGPGAYSPSKHDGSAKYSLGMKTKVGTICVINPDNSHSQLSQSVDFTPGPGAYQAKHVFKNVNGGQRFG